MAKTKVKRCPDCKPHRYQDAVYGLNRRLHNVGNNLTRCTVCGNEKRES